MVQLVREASVSVAKQKTGEIGSGLVVLLGVHRDDSEKDVEYLADKVVNLRIFPDDNGQMNRSVLDVGGEVLVVSQFTLFGDCRKGRRPGYSAAAGPEKADRLYQLFIEAVKKRGVGVATGKFQAMMEVSLINNGPVTLLLDSGKLF